LDLKVSDPWMSNSFDKRSSCSASCAFSIFTKYEGQGLNEKVEEKCYFFFLAAFFLAAFFFFGAAFFLAAFFLVAIV